MFTFALLLACTDAEPTAGEPPPDPPASEPAPAPHGGGFYHLTQGSDQFSYALFRALERPDSTALFSDDLERFGLIPDPAGPDNPHGLPIGLAVSERPGVPFPMVGQTCAACHVGQIDHRGQSMIIDGAPNLYNSKAFFAELTGALDATLADPAKLYRLLVRMLDPDLGFGGRLSEIGGERLADFAEAHPNELAFLEHLGGALRAELRAVDDARDAGAVGSLLLGRSAGLDAAQISDDLKRSLQLKAETAAGDFLHHVEDAAARHSLLAAEVARLTREVRLTWAAVRYGQAYNGAQRLAHTPEGPGRVDAFGTLRAQVVTQAMGPDAARPLTGPASFPHLWGIDSLEWLHWQRNMNAVMGRNVLEALGSGAVVDFQTGESWVEVENLAALEAMTYAFRSPAWPEMFPPIDAALAQRGAEIFDAECARCHLPAASPGDPPRDLPAFTVDEIGVDGTHAANWAAPVGDTPYHELAQALAADVIGHYYGLHGVSDADQRAWENGQPPEAVRYQIADRPLTARPLAGVWATAPYLHNGSVPSLYDLLLPPEQRPRTFPLGHREYDPARVGYLQDVAAPRFVFDVDQPVDDGQGGARPDLPNGNGNGGHTYGTDLSDADRWALVEHLKTL